MRGFSDISDTEKKVVNKTFTRIVEMWKLSEKEAKDLVGLSANQALEEFLDNEESLLRACNVISVFLRIGGGEDHGIRWMREPNGILGYDSPFVAMSRSLMHSDNVTLFVLDVERMEASPEPKYL